ncbi:unnamed protein product, partial [Adineta steineri]
TIVTRVFSVKPANSLAKLSGIREQTISISLSLSDGIVLSEFFEVIDSLDWIMNAMARVKMARTEPPRIKQEASVTLDTRIPVEEESNDEQDI